MISILASFLMLGAGFTDPAPFACSFTEVDLTGTVEQVTCTAHSLAVWECRGEQQTVDEPLVASVTVPVVAGQASGRMALRPQRPGGDCRWTSLTVDHVLLQGSTGDSAIFISGDTLQPTVFGPFVPQTEDSDER